MSPEALTATLEAFRTLVQQAVNLCTASVIEVGSNGGDPELAAHMLNGGREILAQAEELLLEAMEQ